MKLVYKRRALRHIEAIHAHIARENRDAANRAVARIELAISRLTTVPLSARPGPVAGTRLLVVPTLPYIVVYRVQADAVHIIAVLHSSQNRRS
jgi:plasmid stabilization system protein ParE